MELSKYIEQVGDDVAAKLFKVKPRTAASWRRKERHPRPSQANTIVRATKGEVSFADIYGPGRAA